MFSDPVKRSEPRICQAPPAAGSTANVDMATEPDLLGLLRQNRWVAVTQNCAKSRVGSVTRRTAQMLESYKPPKAMALITRSRALNPESPRWCRQNQTQLLGVTPIKIDFPERPTFCSQAWSNPATVKIGFPPASYTPAGHDVESTPMAKSGEGIPQWNPPRTNTQALGWLVR